MTQSPVLMKRFLNHERMSVRMQGNLGFKMSVDTRRNTSSKEGMTMCRKCGCTIVALPNDRRHGFCYDCFDPLESDERIRIPSAMQSRPSGK